MPKNPPSESAVAAPALPTDRANARPTGRAAWLLGPALVAGVAYLDPGNVASNMTAGARFGYLLVWVVVLGNVMAWLIQYLSAKLGIVTGRSLAETLGLRIRSRAGRRAYWLQAELVAMATDVAEVIGGAVALWLLFGVPLVWGGLITGAVSITLLMIQQRRGARSFEFVIIGLMLIIAVGFTYGVVAAPPDAGGVVAGLVPRFDGVDSVLLAASILGATIMPHAIYAHSALARDRFRPGGVADVPDDTDRWSIRSTTRLLRATRWDVTIALAIAGTVNLCILLLAASALAGVPGTDSLEGAYAALRDGLGIAVATLFAVGLLASGLASTAVGAYAGAEIMQGLLRMRVPLLVRRLVTLVPALAILALGVDPTLALVLSQVVLSFGIPFALVPLVALTARRDVLGAFRNRAVTTVAGVVASVFLITLNVVLLWLVFTGG
jgi:manganese transport protein